MIEKQSKRVVVLRLKISFERNFANFDDFDNFSTVENKVGKTIWRSNARINSNFKNFWNIRLYFNTLNAKCKLTKLDTSDEGKNQEVKRKLKRPVKNGGNEMK